MSRPKKPTDWRKRFDTAKPPKSVLLHTNFAGIPAGTLMYIGSPGIFANYISAVPRGERRTVARMRTDLARRNGCEATCPVTTAIFLRVVAETALADLEAGKSTHEVVPFWRVVEPGSTIARKLSCAPDYHEHLIAMDDGVPAQ